MNVRAEAIVQSSMRYAFRTLRNSPGFSATVILTLALGIGANTAAFGLLYGLVLRPMPSPEPERLVVAFGAFVRSGQYGRLSYPNYRDLRDRTKTLESFAAYAWAIKLNLSASPWSPAEQISAQIVSGNFFDTLRIPAALGRTFAPDEDRTRNTHPVTVLGDRFWRARFNADPAIVGQSIRLNGHTFTVIGVAPARMPQVDPPFAPDLWVPMAMQNIAMPSQTNKLDSRPQKWLRGIGRLRPDATLAAVRAEFLALGETLEREHPVENRRVTFNIEAEQDARAQTLGTTARLSWVLAGLVALVLLIACANLANLLLVRAAARAREMSVRASLGAGRAQLLRQLLIEHAILAVAGGLGGAALASFVSNYLWSLLLRRPIVVDSANVQPMIAFAIACTALTMILFGLMPALRATRGDLASELRAHGTAARTGARAGRRRGLLQELLVVSQLALCVIVLVTAALFMRSLSSAWRIDLGFTPADRVTAGVQLELQGYTTERGVLFHDALLERVRQLPGVEAASTTGFLPLTGGFLGDTTIVLPDDRAPANAPRPFVIYDRVGSDYMRTMGTRLLRGRDITEADQRTTPAHAVINTTFAETFWPGVDPIGKQFRVANMFRPGEPNGALVEVVGLTATGQYETLGERPQRRMFLPMRHGFSPSFNVIAHVRGGRPADTLAAIRGIVADLDPLVPVVGAQTLEEHVGHSTDQPRAFALLASVFGGLALLLAVIGVYGTLSFLVRGRTQEIGVRVAVGARPVQVLLLIVRRAGVLAVVGFALGGLGAALVSRAVESMLYGTTRIDAATAIVVASVLAGAVLLASLLPVRRALRIDLVRALRQD